MALYDSSTYYRPVEEILALYKARKDERGPMLSKMLEIQQYYNADTIVVPLPELDEVEKPAVANVMIQGIDQFGARIAGVLPNLIVPSQDPGHKRADEDARLTRGAIYGWWEMNKIKVKLARRARQFSAYSQTPVVLGPDFGRGIPRWKPRSPLASFPSPMEDPDSVEPDDCIFSFVRTYGWLRRQYPDKMVFLEKGHECTDDTRFECLEYVDEKELSVFVLGRSTLNEDHLYGFMGGNAKGLPIVPLTRTPNKAGICPATVAGRITLDRPKGQFDEAPGLYDVQAMLTALEITAVKRGVFPTRYLIARPQETPQVMVQAEPEKGIVGIIKGGDLQNLPTDPGFQVNQTIDRAERAQKLAAGLPSEFGGESGSNIRTGRRGESVFSAVIDPPIAEAQTVLAASLQAENVRAIAIAKAYFGDTPKSFYVNWKGSKGRTKYTPNKNFTSDEHLVEFPMPGADQNGLMIIAGQAVGTGMMSTERGMELLQLVDDVKLEKDRMTTEAIDSGILAEFAQPGSFPLPFKARVKKLVLQDKMSLEDAIDKVQREAQEAQATSGDPGTPTGPVDPSAPEAQPGIAPPGMGVEAGVAPPPAAEPGAPDLAQLLFSLRSAQRTTPQEEAPIAV